MSEHRSHGGSRAEPSAADKIAFAAFLHRMACEGVIKAGPFKGVRFGGESVWGGIAPYLVGSYECELHETIEALVAKGYRTVIDIGCAEGYYAIGLAVRLEEAEVFAFDIDPRARSVCSATAAANGVASRVHVRGACDTHTLEAVVQPGALVVVDCEGAELELLRPDLVPGLCEADLVVELHDFVDPSISGEIIKRFSPTHDIHLIDVTSRDPRQFSALQDQPPWVQFLALFEGRPTEPHPMQWAVMQSRSRANTR